MGEDLREYFEKTDGTGVLSTAGADGRVDAAVYARPHILDDGTAALIMRKRLTRKNLLENPNAAYLFIEQGAEYKGCRLYLTKTGEDTDPERIRKLRRRCPTTDTDPDKTDLVLVTFRIDSVLPLVGGGKQEK
ncbi:MAG: pyridoxamine 5'-phosphate oxidase family protein [Desulfobacteraceae bacterium]|nr:pyridoxamine 5'-phosphate oxidase family protein [Desulfobacteraceae bacterium]MCF8095982.1 pyridoxamine 5'-phosphate oxidase family protein [Desulfobacteraceae bacterium]